MRAGRDYQRVGRRFVAIGLWALLGSGCEDPAPDPEPEAWTVLAEGERGALLSVWGASADDVWIVGADARDGTGPIVLRVQGGEITRTPTGLTEGDLWWVYGFEDGPVFMGGSGGVVLRFEDDEFTRLTTPGTATVFGLWGASPEEMWAVGGASESGGGFAWRLAQDAFVPEATLPGEVEASAALWKIHGTASDDAWIVGSNGFAFRWDGEALSPAATGVGSSLFTVVGDAERFVAVGGIGAGVIVENDGEAWTNESPADALPTMTGVSLAPDGRGLAVGAFGTVVERDDAGWSLSDDAPTFEDLHAAWIDPAGGAWAVGGNTSFFPMTSGVLLYRAP